MHVRPHAVLVAVSFAWLWSGPGACALASKAEQDQASGPLPSAASETQTSPSVDTIPSDQPARAQPARAKPARGQKASTPSPAAAPPLKSAVRVRASQAIAKSADADEPTPWAFRVAGRPVKVVVLAGSIGAWPRNPYAKRLETMCANVEVKNLSRVGLGAAALKSRFRQWVLENKRVKDQSQAHEAWLVFGGGLNSVGDPYATNRHIRHLFLLAHAANFKVMGLSLTPWGEASDKRWKGSQAFWTHLNTRAIVEFVAAQSTPEAALGLEAALKREAQWGEKWDASEIADIGVDLWNSPLRDEAHQSMAIDRARRELARDARWKRSQRDQDEARKDAALLRDAEILANASKWFLRADLRSFDAIHPNDSGHALMAEIICAKAPASWGCTCDSGTPAEDGPP